MFHSQKNGNYSLDSKNPETGAISFLWWGYLKVFPWSKLYVMHTEIRLLPDAWGEYVHSYGVMHTAEDTQAEMLANSKSLTVRENKQMLEQKNASLLFRFLFRKWTTLQIKHHNYLDNQNCLLEDGESKQLEQTGIRLDPASLPITSI